MTARRGSSSHNGRSPAERFGPRRLAMFATARPRLVLSVWGLIAVISIGVTGALLPSALSSGSDSGITSKPESERAQQLIDERLPGSDALDELVLVRSHRDRVTDAVFTARVAALAAQLRRHRRP